MRRLDQVENHIEKGCLTMKPIITHPSRLMTCSEIIMAFLCSKRMSSSFYRIYVAYLVPMLITSDELLAENKWIDYSLRYPRYWKATVINLINQERSQKKKPRPSSKSSKIVATICLGIIIQRAIL